MSKQNRAAGLLLCFVLGLACTSVRAGDDVDSLARDVDRLVSVRQVKDLQRSYAHYSQSGLWDEMAGLFSADGRFVQGAESISGRNQIASWLTRRGGGRRGLAPGALHAQLIDEPLVNLAMDGRTARARWMSMAFVGDGKGTSRIEGGIYENEYVREGGRWKIAIAHYHPHYTGNYEKGWANVGNADLPLVPYHFTLAESGIPVPAPAGAAPRSNASLTTLTQTIDRLNDEDAVRNLQHAYGYYVDRKMWDDVVDLFAEDAVVEDSGTGMFKGRSGARQAMELMGPAGLQQGQLNDHPIFDTMVQVLPGGREAYSRGIELGLVGEASQGTQHWEFAVFRNRFVKEDGLWKFRELRRFPVMHAEYAKGWGDGGRFKHANNAVPAFLGANPATGKVVDTQGFTLLAGRPLTGAIAAGKAATAGGTLAERLVEARRRLSRSMAWDGTENVSSAYGYYIDDFHWPNMGGIFAEQGNKQSPFAGYYLGKDRITGAATAMYGNAVAARTGISYHWRVQLVVNVAADGRSTNLRTRLYQPRTGKAREGAASPAGLFSGMYPNDQAVLENGIWRLWALEIDEPYFTQAGWEGGWSGVQPKPAGSPRPAASPLVTRYPPDLLLTAMGRRAAGFRGGTGETIEWPGILPMWFNYRNPVSGRAPEFYWPDCAPCELMPASQMIRHGYLMPPTGPHTGVQQASTPAIPGVVNAGTPISLIQDGFETVEGPMPQPDGGVLFTNNRVGRILWIPAEGSVSVWHEGPGGANALTRTTRGEVVATLTEQQAIDVIQPGKAPRVLVGKYEGTPFNRPNDLVADRRGNIYFTDTVSLTATAPAAMPSAVYQLTSKGQLVRISSDIARPNGVALSPDERTLYVANTSGESIHAVPLSRNGTAGKQRPFARLATPPPQNGATAASGADGIAVDEKGRIYVATTLGVQVLSPAGTALGIITLPKQPQNLAFSGPDRNVLFVVGRGAVYRIATLTRGPDRSGK